jgi:hypothetical protein
MYQNSFLHSTVEKSTLMQSSNQLHLSLIFFFVQENGKAFEYNLHLHHVVQKLWKHQTISKALIEREARWEMISICQTDFSLPTSAFAYQQLTNTM